jgi:hypothetical protein
MIVVLVFASFMSSYVNWRNVSKPLARHNESPVVKWEQVAIQDFHEASQIWSELRAGTSISSIAARKSVEYKVCSQMADTPSEEVELAMSDLGVGELSSIVAAENRCLIVRVLDRRD